MSLDFNVSANSPFLSSETPLNSNLQALQNPAFSPGAMIRGTVGGLTNNGDRFTLTTSGGQAVEVDPDNIDARQLGLKSGDLIQIQVSEWDGQTVDTNLIQRQDGSPIFNSPNSSVFSSSDDSNTIIDTVTGETIVSDLFDSQTYLKNNPDVAAAGVNPWQHFINHGAQEGRMPHLFNQAFYLSQYPDLQAAYTQGLNPWQHFLEHGAREGRIASPTGTAQQSQALQRLMLSIDDSWRSQDDSSSDGSSLNKSHQDQDDLLLDDYDDSSIHFNQVITGTVTQQLRADRFLFNSKEFGQLHVETDNDTPITVKPGESLTLVGEQDQDDPEFEIYQATRSDGSLALNLPQSQHDND